MPRGCTTTRDALYALTMGLGRTPGRAAGNGVAYYGQPTVAEQLGAPSLIWPPMPSDHAPWRWVNPIPEARRATLCLMLSAALIGFDGVQIFAGLDGLSPWVVTLSAFMAVAALISSTLALRGATRAALLRIPAFGARGLLINPDDIVRAWWAILLWPPAPLLALRDVMRLAAGRTPLDRRTPTELGDGWWLKITALTITAVLAALPRALVALDWITTRDVGTLLASGAFCAAVAMLMLARTVRTLAAITGAR